MQFLYSDRMAYAKIENLKIRECLSKHALRLESVKAQQLQQEAEKLGHSRIWGHSYGLARNEEQNRISQLYTVSRMIYEKCKNPFRIVIDDKGCPWIDNLHSAIRDILVYGDQVRIKDVPHYIVDVSFPNPAVFDPDGAIRDSLNDIKGAVQASLKCNSRINDTIRSIGYTIGEFMAENEVTRNSLGINLDLFNEYKK